MKQIAFLVISLTACFLSSVHLAAAQDTIALSFDLPQADASSRAESRVTPAIELPSRTEVALAQSPPQSSPLPPEAAISFNLPQDAKAAPAVADSEIAKAERSIAAAQPADAPDAPDDAALFAGGSESVVARTVGHAEGTRSADGGKNPGYYGHVDPGNGVWNRGTFSYQFGNAENLSPEEADRRQLDKIKGHYDRAVAPKAEQLGMELSLEEKLNAIDLANQAPLAVTEEGGFVDRLAEAKREKKLEPDQATLEARVWSFWDNKKGGWDAPGLRAYDHVSKEESIRRDQDRRMKAISDALQAYDQEQTKPLLSPEPPPKQAAAPPPPDQIANPKGS